MAKRKDGLKALLYGAKPAGQGSMMVFRKVTGHCTDQNNCNLALSGIYGCQIVKMGMKQAFHSHLCLGVQLKNYN
jgi:hypothetical protein